MSLKNKLARVFQMGFAAGVKSTSDNWNASTFFPEPERDEVWESKYKFELENRLVEFFNYMEKGNAI